MITLSAQATSALTRSHTVHVRAESWLGGTLLADDLPISDASEQTDWSVLVPERVSFTLPRRDRGTSWSPVDEDHPLAARGQQLRVELGVGLDDGQVEWFQRGWFPILTSGADGDAVTVEAVGRLQLIREAELITPFQPSGTMLSSLRALVEPALTVVADTAVVDRAVPAALNYDRDRLAAVWSLLDAWPADARVAPDGYLTVFPETSSTVVLTLTDGAGGTVVDATGASSREDVYTAVVARGTDANGAQIQGVAYALGASGEYGGDLNPFAVPYFYESPLLTTVAQCQAAAAKILARLRRRAARVVEIECVPHPGLELGDRVAVESDDFTGEALVEAFTLPYTADGPMTIKVSEVA